MTYELTNEEKIEIINQHIKSLAFSKFNLETSLLAENSLTSPDQVKVDLLTQQIADISTKISALNLQVASLSA